ncbi:hypothetical protein TNCV_4694151 [Trichonephila clavipes]|uniref:Uncharacterized protein n=1 Tax=Trichonephila clavipes TaxID=2585209 RepID=A0A8X6WCG7_TRICX|nr:hypothetical protein TNCV_4694151 [Trichonephila clavipes]
MTVACLVMSSSPVPLKTRRVSRGLPENEKHGKGYMRQEGLGTSAVEHMGNQFKVKMVDDPDSTQDVNVGSGINLPHVIDFFSLRQSFVPH